MSISVNKGLIFKLLCIILLSWILPLSSSAQTDFSADQLNSIAESPEWRYLLHYKKAEYDSNKKDKSWLEWPRESYVDGKGFFLSPDGKHSPLAELTATVEQFKSGNTEAICRFPARFEFLKDPLSLQGDVSACAELSEWFAALSPQSLSLIYADSFLNNPASLFGHTFLKLNSEKGTPLIDYIIQYHAAIGKEPGVVFAAKGVFGGYNGYFQLAPYYQSITKYNDYEQRDIWEYKLNLTREELRRVLLHLWELKDIPIDYFYFDENCSFHILSLLKVARPSLQLYGDLLPWVIPLDTLKGILKNENLLESIEYRPSRSSRLIQREKELDSDQVSLAKAVVRDGIAEHQEGLNKYEPAEQAKVLEASSELFEYLNLRKEGSSKLLEILGARSKLPARDKPFEVPQPEVKPHKAHDSRRFATERGFHTKKGIFVSAEIRPAYHALLDPPESFPAGSAIEVGSTRLRWTETRGVELDKISLVKISSYTPDTAFVNKYSWDFATQIEESELSSDGRIGSIDLGFGKSFALNNQANLFSILPRIKYEAGNDSSLFAQGISVTLLFGVYDKLRVKIQHENYFKVSGQDQLQFSSEIAGFYPFYEDSGITFRVLREKPYGERGIMAMTGWQWFF